MLERITNQYFDLGRGEIFRIFKMYLVSRCLPLGNLAGFTRIRQLLLLMVVHCFGRSLFRLLVPQEERLTKLYRMIRKS